MNSNNVGPSRRPLIRCNRPLDLNQSGALNGRIVLRNNSELSQMASAAMAPGSAKQANVAIRSTGFVAALFLAALYVLWALSVVTGAAQSLMNLIVQLDVIPPVYV